jgi:hypothetical protein
MERRMPDSDRVLLALPAVYEAAGDSARMSHLADAISPVFDAESAIICLCRKPDPTPSRRMSRTKTATPALPPQGERFAAPSNVGFRGFRPPFSLRAGRTGGFACASVWRRWEQ